MASNSAPFWRKIQRENFTSLNPLMEFLELDATSRERLLEAPRFPLNLPRRLAEKIQKNSIDDPIFRQFVPCVEEKHAAKGYVLDPVQDRSFCKTGKILQKYRGRALLLSTSACAMHCRYCFRQNFPYETEVVGFQKEIEILSRDDSISEVILSGGDPLSLSDTTLRLLFQSLDEIPHIKRIRFHTRFPVGIPERIDSSFLSLLSSTRKTIIFVIHCNHPREMDKDVVASLKKVQQLGIPVLNQSVLLEGVNDRENILLELSETLIQAGIIPYYLHQLDLVQGASHFFVSEARALELVRFLQKNVSGFAVPRLVREEPGCESKSYIY